MRRLMLLVVLLPAVAHASYAEYRLPWGVSAKRVTVLSEGTPLAAHVVQARSHTGKPLPTVILCQGTGGLQHYHLHQAEAFAKAGYTVITFDYRGWGESRGRLIPAEAKTSGRDDARSHKLEVIEVRETVDPVEQVTDIAAVVAWAMAEPAVDTSRLGLWGTSLGASLALSAAINEPRIRAVVAQVGPYELRRGGTVLEELRRDATRRARGELPYPAPKPRERGKLHGHRIMERYQVFSPYEDMSRLAGRAPQPAVLIIDAEKEELFDIRAHGERVFDRLTGPKSRVVVPGISHYDVYRGEALQRVTDLALEWYDKHLK